jgi:hypothetical protein
MVLSRTVFVVLQELGVTIFEHQDHELSIGLPWVTAAVAAFQLFVKMIFPILLLNPSPILELLGDTIALGVHIRSDVVSYLSSSMAKANTSIEGRRTEPERSVIFSLGRAPEPDMVSLSRAVSDGLLEGEVLLPAQQIETTYWSLVVRSPEDRINHDAKAALQRYRIGWGPPDSHHRADQFFLCADDGDVKRIARVAIRGVRNSIDVLQRGVMPEIELPDGGRQQVSGYGPD